MANSDKNIVITPNTNQSGLPSISFVGFGNSSITLKSLDDSLGTLSFQDSGSGQMFGLDTNTTGLARNAGTIFRVNDNDGLSLLNINTNFNTTIDLAPKEGSVRVHGHNYVESACYSLTASSRNTIVTNNDGYVQFEIPSDPSYFCTNPEVMEIINTGNYGIRFRKPGIVHMSVSQDIIGSSTTGYITVYFYVNGSNKANHLISNTAGEWDGLNAYQILRVAPNDIVQVRILQNAADITAIDVGSWSYYSVLFHALPV